MRASALVRASALALLLAAAGGAARAQSPIMPSDAPSTRAPGAAPSAAPASPETGETAPTRRRTRAGSPERQAKSKECSAEADKQSLHGKPRKEFRSKCMRG